MSNAGGRDLHTTMRAITAHTGLLLHVQVSWPRLTGRVTGLLEMQATRHLVFAAAVHGNTFTFTESCRAADRGPRHSPTHPHHSARRFSRDLQEHAPAAQAHITTLKFVSKTPVPIAVEGVSQACLR
jgi:hypothetical protein